MSSHERPPRPQGGRLGLPLALLSAATFATSGSFAGSLIAAGWTPGAVVIVRVGLASLILTVPAVLQLRSSPVTRASARVIALYGLVAVAVAQLCYFSALSHLSVALAMLLEYSGILLVVAWGWVRHGHRPRRLTGFGGATAVAGLVLVLDLAGSHRLDLIGVLWGLGAAVGLAAYFVLAAEADNTLSPLVVTWGGLAVGGAVLASAGLTGVLPVHAAPTAVTLLDRRLPWLVPVLGLAIVAAVIAYLAGIVGARLLGAKLASFVGLTEVLFAVFFAWFLLGQRLEPIQLVGGALVVAGIGLVRLDEMRGVAPAVPSPAPPAVAARPGRRLRRSTLLP